MAAPKLLKAALIKPSMKVLVIEIFARLEGFEEFALIHPD